MWVFEFPKNFSSSLTHPLPISGAGAVTGSHLSCLPSFLPAKSFCRLIEYKKPRSKHNINWTAGGLLAQEDKFIDFVESSVENMFSAGSKDYFAFCILSPKIHPEF